MLWYKLPYIHLCKFVYSHQYKSLYNHRCNHCNLNRLTLNRQNLHYSYYPCLNRYMILSNFPNKYIGITLYKNPSRRSRSLPYKPYNTLLYKNLHMRQNTCHMYSNCLR